MPQALHSKKTVAYLATWKGKGQRKFKTRGLVGYDSKPHKNQRVNCNQWAECRPMLRNTAGFLKTLLTGDYMHLHVKTKLFVTENPD